MDIGTAPYNKFIEKCGFFVFPFFPPFFKAQGDLFLQELCRGGEGTGISETKSTALETVFLIYALFAKWSI